MLRMGTVIGGKYRLLARLGKGGTSVVFLAEDLHVGRKWAVKELSSSGISAEMILHEAEILRDLDYPVFPRVADLIAEGSAVYIVMDYIPGRTLEELVRKEGPPEEKQVLEWMIILCKAMRYLHRRNPPVIYRDLKPSNIMVQPDGRLKLIDFGTARRFRQESACDTVPLGTPGYAAPEQSSGRQSDPRTDVYGLGMTMHYLLTGKDPRAQGFCYHPVRYWNPSVSRKTERLVERCTALDPEKRFPDCEKMLRELYRIRLAGADSRVIWKRSSFLFTILLCISLITGSKLIASHIDAGGDRQQAAAADTQNSVGYVQNASASSAAFGDRKDFYLAEMKRKPGMTEGYCGYLSCCREKETFTEEESGNFEYLFQRNVPVLRKRKDYAKLLFEAGLTYFYCYSGDDGSFRARALRAAPYFLELRDTEDAEYRKRAGGYDTICNFYTRYVTGVSGMQEPSGKEYESLLDSFQDTITAETAAETNCSSYEILVFFREVLHFVNDRRDGFAVSGVSPDRILSLLILVKQKGEAVYASQPQTICLQKEVEELCGTYMNNIKTAYGMS